MERLKQLELIFRIERGSNHPLFFCLNTDSNELYYVKSMERKTTQQINEQKEQIDKLSERLTILQETLKQHGINPSR